MALLFLIITAFVISVFEKKIHGTFVSPASVFIWPMVFSILIVSTIGKALNFYQMKENELYIILLGLIFFFLGEILSDLTIQQKRRNLRIHKINLTKGFVDISYKYFLFVIIFIFGKYLFVFYKYGIRNYIISDGLSGSMSQGLSIHLALSVYPLVPIFLEKFIREKKKIKTLVVLFFFVEMFFTFTKYHVIFLIVSSFLYIISIYPKYFLPLVLFTLFLAVIAFSINYIVNFRANGTSARLDFLLNHFINYLCGGMIYTSVNDVEMSTDFFHVVMAMIIPFPNLFLRFFFGVSFFPPINSDMIYLSPYERGNVINFISYIFHCGNYVYGSIFFVMFSFIINTVILSNNGQTVIRLFLLTILSLSFFGNYFQLVIPWEILLWSGVISFLINKINIGKSNIFMGKISFHL